LISAPSAISVITGVFQAIGFLQIWRASVGGALVTRLSWACAEANNSMGTAVLTGRDNRGISTSIAPMKSNALIAAGGLLIAVALKSVSVAAEATSSHAPHVAAASEMQAGRYLVVVGGCNDCHTEGYRESRGATPEANWLTGRKAGYLGPWGTTYSANLRLTTQAITENDWVTMLRIRRDAPPMPWMNVNQISERDARAIYRYIRSLGAKGAPAPARLPPGQTPKGPYQSMMTIAPSIKLPN
jgi:mono/diheme cytochrome c family protein